jgi:hypothetical protein
LLIVRVPPNRALPTPLSTSPHHIFFLDFQLILLLLYSSSQLSQQSSGWFRLERHCLASLASRSLVIQKLEVVLLCYTISLSFTPPLAMSLLPPDVHAAILELLNTLKSSDNALRARAEEVLNTEWVQQKPDVLLMALTEQILASEEAEVWGTNLYGSGRHALREDICCHKNVYFEESFG